MRGRRARAALVAGLTAGFVLIATSLARASDVFQNIGPASPLPGAGSIARYSLSRYALDQHFTIVSASLTGGIDVSGVFPGMAWLGASIVWLGTSFVAKGVVELFAFAFNLDLVNGSASTGGAGALAPVSEAIHSIYADVFGAPWLAIAVSAVGLWAIWKALVQRRYSETAGALALSLVYVVLALFFVIQPGQTIGQASRWTNEMSQAFLSISDHGDPSGGQQATDGDAEELWSLLVLKPWGVLEFGGLEHCVKAGTGDDGSDPESVPVRPLAGSPAADAALSQRLQAGTEVSAAGKVCENNLNKYGRHFLRFGFGTDERNEEYDALNDGDPEKLPEADDEKAGYNLGVPDKPATDAMEEGGQYQRFLLALIVAAGDLGAFLLLGSLAIGVILSQVLLLLLLAFSPVALVAAAIPGRGHAFFKSWLEKLAGYLLRKAAYSLVLAILLAVNGALADATSSLGWLFAFGLQAIFFWAVLIQRKTLVGGIVGIATGPRAPANGVAVDALALYTGARLFRGPARAAGGSARGARRAGGRALGGGSQEGARKGPSLGGATYTLAGVGAAGGAAGRSSTSKGGQAERGGAATEGDSPKAAAASAGEAAHSEPAAAPAEASGAGRGERGSNPTPKAPPAPASGEVPAGKAEEAKGEADPPSEKGSAQGAAAPPKGTGATGEVASEARRPQRPKPTPGPEQGEPQATSPARPSRPKRPGGPASGALAPEASASASGTSPASESRLSEELRGERERAEGGRSERCEEKAEPKARPTEPRPAPPSSPPRRRRLRLRLPRRRK